MRDFLEGLEENADMIINEAEDAGSSGGETFAQAVQGAKWAYIPQPKGSSAADVKSGAGGFGSAKNSLLVIRENNPDSWDIYVMKFGKGQSLGSAEDKAAAAALRKRAGKEEPKAQTSEAREIEKYMNLAEEILSGKVLEEEALGNVEGWTELLKDANWKVSKKLTGLKFADLLEKCVAVVAPKAEGGAASFLK